MNRSCLASLPTANAAKSRTTLSAARVGSRI